ncbi:hypothetical protein T492DRAFT_868245 [Pavlovales sp. CCMP2436]|nr:hypothetical protein T492DRAFT_868245 [Pavlovales sp. CCMP2436]
MDLLIAFSAGVLGYKSYLAMQRHPADRSLTCSSTADPLTQLAAIHSVDSAFAH